jgi:hypothetical protein
MVMALVRQISQTLAVHLHNLEAERDLEAEQDLEVMAQQRHQLSCLNYLSLRF